MHVTKRALVGTLAAAAMAVSAFGCASTPTTTAQATAPEQAQSDRSVLAVGDEMTFSQAWSALPKQISEADAATMLTTIDPSKVVTEPNFSVQQRGRGGFGRFGGGIRGAFRGYGGSRFYGYGRGFGGYRYYNLRGRYFPYYRYGSFYRPYYYNNYYPYLYNYANTYYPYCYRW